MIGRCPCAATGRVIKNKVAIELAIFERTTVWRRIRMVAHRIASDETSLLMACCRLETSGVWVHRDKRRSIYQSTACVALIGKIWFGVEFRTWRESILA